MVGLGPENKIVLCCIPQVVFFWVQYSAWNIVEESVVVVSDHLLLLYSGMCCLSSRCWEGAAKGQ